MEFIAERRVRGKLYESEAGEMFPTKATQHIFTG